MHDDVTLEHICLWLILFAFSLHFTGCNRIQYVPAHTVVKDSIQLVHVNIDTVIYRDSIYIDRSRDTVYKYVDRWRIQYKLRTDTCYVSKTDSIPVEVLVEKELSTLDQIKVDYGGISIAINAVVICIAVIWLIKRAKGLHQFIGGK